MTILGIETSCDETALALLETRQVDGTFECRVIASLVHSQAELHSAYGGVFPTLAKREHGKNLVPLLHKLLLEWETGDLTPQEQNGFFGRGLDRALKKHFVPGGSANDFAAILKSFRAELIASNPDLWESFKGADFLQNTPAIDAIAVTEGPGLEPALWVGINFARVLGALWQVPIIPVNHMEGHIVGSLLNSDAPRGAWQKLKPVIFPALALLISGGHTELIRIDEKVRYSILGQTKDDAVGEAFDKTARLLGLPYPGGPHISMLAHQARELGLKSAVKLPRPMMTSNDLDFSFSGLKTAVLYAVRDHSVVKGTVSEHFKKELALEFENAVTDVLDAKLRKAIDSIGAKTVIVGGGVSANATLRNRFQTTASEYGLLLYLPSHHISGDNALMIALAATLSPHSSHELKPANLKAHGTKKLA